MGTTDLNDYLWKMDAEIALGLEIDGPLVAEACPTEQQATEDTVGDAVRERVIPHELEPRKDLSPLYDREIEEIDEESTALKKHSGYGGEVCKGRRPRKRLRGIKGTSIEIAIVVDDDNDDDDKEIRRSTCMIIPPNQPGMVRWVDPSFNKTAAEDFYRFWHAMKICWCVGTSLYPLVGFLSSFDLKHLPRRNGPKEFRQFALLMEKVCKRVKEKGAVMMALSPALAITPSKSPGPEKAPGLGVYKIRFDFSTALPVNIVYIRQMTTVVCRVLTTASLSSSIVFTSGIPQTI
ncbi:hypothetical protein K469DRAFT_752882 [Zopfia rhizophila CBS 207.26]|uniref:Uncharacterized protein n=1 Tax=Zopfia rhizophila CBS 207.26 TaxID=1314779 RepID=A0A6A6DR25_9PEZI|nr:hypothetical protein K469DRAFT_752882 [Zopfia rhizophila CBS 207.26]